MKLINTLKATSKMLLMTLAGFLSLSATIAVAQNDRFANVTIDTIPVAGPVSMLTGSGGNIGVSAGADGILIVDDQYASLAGRIKNALAELGSNSPQFVLNTHFHGDHTGGNVEFGTDSLIVAHTNVRGRMQSNSAPAEALPMVTYDDRISIHFNGEDIALIHLPSGHTDTDSVVMFSASNVIHMGDLFFNGSFPFVDLNNGGSLQGYLDNVQTALSWIEDDTDVIPGHGPLATKADLQRFYDVVKETSDTILSMKSREMSLERAVETGLGSEYESWGQGFISEERWIGTVYAADDAQ
ncbi:MAG: MBL fold metallo-hydrolase [Pseudohongiellaceae bacterium]